MSDSVEMTDVEKIISSEFWGLMLHLTEVYCYSVYT